MVCQELLWDVHDLFGLGDTLPDTKSPFSFTLFLKRQSVASSEMASLTFFAFWEINGAVSLLFLTLKYFTSSYMVSNERFLFLWVLLTLRIIKIGGKYS